MTGPDDTQPPADPTPPAGAAGAGAAATPDGSAAAADAATRDSPAGAGDQATPDGEGVPRSGLRNPAAAVRGVGAGALVIEALILLLAIVPLTKLDTRATGWAVGAVLTLSVLCVALAGLLRYRWAWYAGIVVQLLVCACGFFHLMLLVFGIIFGAVWAYVLSVRRSVLGEL